MKGILTEEQQDLLVREQTALRDLQGTLIRCAASRDDLTTLEQSIRQLDELFLLVVVGEFFISFGLEHRAAAVGVRAEHRSARDRPYVVDAAFALDQERAGPLPRLRVLVGEFRDCARLRPDVRLERGKLPG